MKKVIICLCMFLFSAVNAVNASPVDLQVRIVNPNGPHKPIGRGPVEIPSVILEDHTLVFNSSCDNCALYLFNEDGDIEYATVISEGTTSLTLPSSLSGEYEIQLLRGQFIFYGFIEL